MTQVFLRPPARFWRAAFAMLASVYMTIVQADSNAPGSVRELHDLDPYYSSIAAEVPLTTEPIPVGSGLSEAEVYRQLFKNSLRPRILLVEASAYPLPYAGTWIKRHDPEFYNDFAIGPAGNNRINLLENLTAGFQEPWAISAFTGSAMRFSSEENHSEGNRGYMGYLVSFGDKHIHDNTLIADNWYEAEWKLKGERNVNGEKLNWSFRLGIKNHGNADIRDVFYVGLHRNDLDYGKQLNRWLANSEFETLSEFDRHNGRFLRETVTVGRRYPLPGNHMALGLDIGAIYENAQTYTGALADLHHNTVTLILRPDIEF